MTDAQKRIKAFAVMTMNLIKEQKERVKARKTARAYRKPPKPYLHKVPGMEFPIEPAIHQLYSEPISDMTLEEKLELSKL